MKLSPVMLDALRKLVAEYDTAVLNERVRWGAELKGGIDASGASKSYRTIHALIDRGMLTFERCPKTTETLRKGSWGKLLGGTNKHYIGILIVKPTDAARAALAVSK